MNERTLLTLCWYLPSKATYDVTALYFSSLHLWLEFVLYRLSYGFDNHQKDQNMLPMTLDVFLFGHPLRSLNGDTVKNLVRCEPKFLLESKKSVELHLHGGPVIGRTTDCYVRDRKEKEKRRKTPAPIGNWTRDLSIRGPMRYHLRSHHSQWKKLEDVKFAPKDEDAVIW